MSEVTQLMNKVWILVLIAGLAGIGYRIFLDVMADKLKEKRNKSNTKRKNRKR